jgi:hypothetical protein
MNPYENVYAPKRGFPFAALAVFLILIALGLAGVSIYLYIEKDSAKVVVDIQATEAAAAARAEQLVHGQQEFDAYVAQTTKTFESNSDFGSVKFDYPENWSAYNDIDGRGKDTTTYTAYFSPGIVAPVTEKHAFLHALEVKIFKATFDSIANDLKGYINDGRVTVENYTLVNEHNPSGIQGQKLTGYVYKNDVSTGTIIQFVLRDKVLQLYNMQPEYSDTFYDLILKTLRWTK